MKHSILLTACALAMAAMIPVTAAAQESDGATDAAETSAETPAETPPNPALIAPQTERDLAVIEKERIEAKLAAQKAKLEYATLGLPTSDISGIDGKVTVENSGGYYAEVLAYDALSHAARVVACDVSQSINTSLGGSDGDTKTGKVVLGDVNGFGATAQLYNMLDAQFDRVEKGLVDQLNEPKHQPYYTDHGDSARNPFYTVDNSALAVLGAIQGVLGTVRGISQFFQTELTISGRAVTIDQASLDANIAASLLGSKLPTVCTTSTSSANLSVSLPGTGLSTSTGLLAKFDSLTANRKDLSDKKAIVSKNLKAANKKHEADKKPLSENLEAREKALQEAQAANNQRRINELTGEITGLNRAIKTIDDKVTAAKKQETEILAKIDPALTLADEFIKLVTTTNDAGQTPLQVIAVVDQLKSGTNTYLLSAKLASQGGELQMKKNAWSGSVGYLGGTVITYMLMDSQGNIIAAGQNDSVRTATKKRGDKIHTLERGAKPIATSVQTIRSN